jgi:hypothetical protein
MRTLSRLLLAGVGAVALAGVAAAQTAPMHRMTIQLPDGSVEQIQYSGPVAPRVSVTPATAAEIAVTPFWPAGPDPMLAQFEQVSAAMDREADAMMQQAAAIMNQPGMITFGPNSVWQIDSTAMPPGAQSYSYAATIGPNGASCSESMTVTAAGPGRKPHVVRHESGNCSGAGIHIMTPGEIGQPTVLSPSGARPGHVMSVQATQPWPNGATIRRAAYVPQE